MTREADIDLLAKALCDSMTAADPDNNDPPWADMSESNRHYYRKRIKDLLLKDEVLVRLVLLKRLDDGTEVAVGGEPGANTGASE